MGAQPPSPQTHTPQSHNVADTDRTPRAHRSRGRGGRGLPELGSLPHLCRRPCPGNNDAANNNADQPEQGGQLAQSQNSGESGETSESRQGGHTHLELNDRRSVADAWHLKPLPEHTHSVGQLLATSVPGVPAYQGLQLLGLELGHPEQGESQQKKEQTAQETDEAQLACTRHTGAITQVPSHSVQPRDPFSTSPPPPPSPLPPPHLPEK